MTHARIPDFSQPIPRRRPVALGTTRVLVVDHQQAAPVLLVDDARVAIDPWEAAAPARLGPASTPAGRLVDMVGDLLAAFVIVGGGLLLTGFASLH